MNEKGPSVFFNKTDLKEDFVLIEKIFELEFKNKIKKDGMIMFFFNIIQSLSAISLNYCFVHCTFK